MHILLKAYLIKKRVLVIHITMQESHEKFESSLPFVLNDSCWEKSSNL